MIKLSRLYVADEAVFPEIKFRDGLNVIFASVTKSIESAASHSLGKTTLIDVIDFCFLKTISADSFLKKEQFADFVFFLEVMSGEGQYVTIRRPVVGRISIKLSEQSDNFSGEDGSDWSYPHLAFKSAKACLNELITPKIITDAGYGVRNGLRYCLRKQTQYEHTFKVNSSRERDLGWKPYLSLVLGMDPSIVKEKYESNLKVDSLTKAIKELDAISTDSGSGLEAEITQLEAAISKMNVEVDGFDFIKSDESVSRELVEEVSAQVVSCNKKIYSIDQRIRAINKSLSAEFTFELDNVLELFSEVKIHFPEALRKSYEDLIRVNEEMSLGRKQRLKKTRSQIKTERVKLESKLTGYSKRQSELSGMLLQRDMFEKYKEAQGRIGDEETRLGVLKERLRRIDIASDLEGSLVLAESAQVEAGKQLELEARVRGNARLTQAVRFFGEFVQQILSISAFFYPATNKDKNLEFKIGLKDQTSVNQGFSYTRVLSAVFDLTLLVLHADEEFYRFSYHDGLLESLDDRVKKKLISAWREVSEKNGLQLIISVLDSDLPLGSSGKAYFEDIEIIRELHDRGDDGRLFKMAAF